MEDVLPPHAGAQHVAVVGEPEELGRTREAQVRALEREDDRVYDRIRGHRDHHDRRRPDQPGGEPALCACPLGDPFAPARCRCGARGIDRAHSNAPEESDSLISLRSVETTPLGLMLEVGDSAFWMASVTSA